MDYSIKILQRERTKQVEGLTYIMNSTLEPEERADAAATVQKKIADLKKAIKIIQEFNSKVN